MFCKAVIHSVFLYGFEMWAITKSMLKVLERFHHRVARRLSGLMLRYPLADALQIAGLFPMEEYVSRCHNRLADYVTTRPIFELCGEAERQSGSPQVLVVGSS
jgi:hypothetical protein